MGNLLAAFNKNINDAEDEKDEDEDEEKEEKKEEKPATLDQELRRQAKLGNEAKIKELLEQGADLNNRDMGEKAEREKQEALEAAANPNKKKKKKDKKEEEGEALYQVHDKITEDTPLHIAVENGHVDIVSQLFYLGARMDVQNRLGSTPLHRAVSSNNIGGTEQLLKIGADVHAKNRLGNTPLHLAAIIGSIPMLELLLKHGAKSDLKVINKVYLTPVEYTQRNSPERGFLLQQFPELKALLTDDEPQEEKHQHHQEERKE